jgi:hypothetical protein
MWPETLHSRRHRQAIGSPRVKPERSRATLSKPKSGPQRAQWLRKQRSSVHSDDETCLEIWEDLSPSWCAVLQHSRLVLEREERSVQVTCASFDLWEPVATREFLRRPTTVHVTDLTSINAGVRQIIGRCEEVNTGSLRGPWLW